MKCKVDGVTYKSKPATDGCNGCVGYNADLCTRLDLCPSIIWVKAKAKKTFEHDGKTYKAVPEVVPGMCTGCARRDGTDLCAALASEGVECGDNGVIWVEKKPKPKYEVWLNVYETAVAAHLTREEADSSSSGDRIACVRVKYAIPS